MRRRTICSGIIITAGVGFLLAAMLNMISFHFIAQIPIELPDSTVEVLTEGLDVIPGFDNGTLNCSGFALIRELLRAKRETASDTFNHLLLYFQITMLLPYILVIPVIVLALFRKRWGYAVTTGLSLVSGGFLGADCLLVFPKVLVSVVDNAIGKVTDNNALKIADSVIGGGWLEKLEDWGAEAGAQIPKIWISSLGIGFWVSLALAVIMLAASVAGIVLAGESAGSGEDKGRICDDSDLFNYSVRDRDRGIRDGADGAGSRGSNSVPAGISADRSGGRAPGIYFLCGEYAGSSIPLQPGDRIVIGRDAGVCNLVMTDRLLSGKHCCISYDASRNCYVVEAYAGNVALADGRQIPIGQAVQLRMGTVLTLGNTQNQMRLG